MSLSAELPCRHASYVPASVKYDGISNVAVVRRTTRFAAPGSEPGGNDGNSRFWPLNAIELPKFFMVIPNWSPRQPVLYWTPKSNASPFAETLAMFSFTKLAVPPKFTRSVNSRAQVSPSTENVGRRISPVPSGACSVVTTTSPTGICSSRAPFVPLRAGNVLVHEVGGAPEVHAVGELAGPGQLQHRERRAQDLARRSRCWG